MIYRPKLQKPKIKITEKPAYIFDIAGEINKVAEIANELEKLKREYRLKIADLEQLKNKTETEIEKDLKELNANFVKDAFKIIQNSSLFVIQKFEEKLQEAKNELNRARIIQKGDTGDNGKDGISPDINSIVKNVINLIPLPKDGKDAVIDEIKIIEAIIKKLLEKGLEIKNIKNLEETLRHLSSKTMLGGKMGGGGGSWKQKQLSGTINGSNTVFTFAGDPPAEFSERVFLNYIEQNPFTDYTISGTTVTYTTAPDASLSGFPHIIRFM